MQCPKCQKLVADFNTGEGVVVNFCRNCKGLWCDAGELALLGQTDSNIPDLTSRVETAHPTSLQCPRCLPSMLVELPYKEGEDVLIDWCPACHGIWLDAGELQKIKRIAGHTVSPPVLVPPEPGVDWRRWCGGIGYGLLLVGVVWPFVDRSGFRIKAMLLYILFAAIISFTMSLTMRLAGRSSERLFGLTRYKHYKDYEKALIFGGTVVSFWLLAYSDVLTTGAVFLFVGAACVIAASLDITIQRSVFSLGGRQVQFQPQDTANELLVDQMRPLLVQFEAKDRRYQDTSASEWCIIHHCQMIPRRHNDQLYWAHHLDNGQWCHGTMEKNLSPTSEGEGKTR